MNREAMPICAAFVDELRLVFGRTEIDAVIKRGLRPECNAGHRVWFSEGGRVLGRQAVAPVVAVSAAEMVLIVPKKEERR